MRTLNASPVQKELSAYDTTVDRLAGGRFIIEYQSKFVGDHNNEYEGSPLGGKGKVFLSNMKGTVN